MIKISSICLLPTAKMLDAMKVIELNDAKVALVVNEENELLGTVTDGDIRRALIRNASVSSPVSQVMNSSPFKIQTNYTRIEAENIFKSKKISQLPVVDENNKVVDLLLSRQHFEVRQKKHTVVIMAGGLGSRLGELTANYPKPMLKVGDKPILQILLENLKESGFTDVLIAVNYKADVIMDYFGNGDNFGLNIQYIKETERLGTAGALSLFKPKNNLPVIVMNGDVLTKVDFTQLIEFHSQNELAASMCVRKYDMQIPYGVVYVDGAHISKIEEKPIESFLVNAGIYVLNAETLSLVPLNTYFDMPSLFEKIVSSQKKKAGVFPIHEYWIDVGRKDDFEQAQLDIKKVY